MKYLSLGLSFLTILPVHLKEKPLPGDLGRAAGWFPFIGAVLGAVVAGAFYGLNFLFPPPLTAVLITALWIGLTGGLHLDGLADCCDGLMSASSPERRLEIMKDPRLGTFGGIGLFLAILVKAAGLYSIPAERIWVALPLAAATARWLLLLAGRQPLARPGGMGADFSSGLTMKAFLPAALVAGLLAALAGWRGMAAFLAANLVALLVFRLARRRLGGVTGDVFGLVVELGELVVLTAFCLRVTG